MALGAVVLMAAMSGTLPASEMVQYFPSRYFTGEGRVLLQREVMASWPGPSELVRIWDEPDLTEEQRVTLLLGGAVFRDPILLPVYREALTSTSQRLRRAAVFGYRDLIADGLPNVEVPVDGELLQGYANEMRFMEETLQVNSLLAMWLQSALESEGGSLPGYVGIRLTRPPQECLRAAESLVDVGDLELLVTAYEQAQAMRSRIGLLQLIEAVTLSKFIVMPKGQNAGWGMEVYEGALRRLDAHIRQWRDGHCRLDGEAILLGNLAAIGARNRDPLGANSERLWLAVLESGESRWWMLAARRLYACGGPWYELSAIRSEATATRDRREELIGWYNPKLERPPEQRPKLRRWTDR